jgi:APA family basic amino acid/polyamine antiporter
LSTEKKVFVRKATGLVREIGFWTAAIIVICNVVGAGWQKRVFQFTGPYIVPESQMIAGIPAPTMAFIVVGIIVLLTVFMFAVLGAAMPRSGGGYVYVTRILHPGLGFLAAVLEYFSIAVSWGMIACICLEAVGIYGWMAGLGTAWLTPMVELVIGLIITAAFAGIAVFGISMVGRLLSLMFWIPLAITVLLYGILLSSTPASMEMGVKMLTGLTPTQMTQMALDQGMATAFTGGYWAAMAGAAIGAYWAYIGFAASTFVGGEVKEAGRALPRTLFAANIFIILLYVSISYVSAHTAMLVGKVGDYSFFSGYSYLSWNAAGKLPAGVGPVWMPTIAGMSAAGMGLSWVLPLLTVFAIFWVANDMPPFVVTSSRIVFAMSFDRVLPEKLSEVNERWHSPTTAILVTMVVAFIGCFSESNIVANVPVLGAYINAGGAVAWTDIWDTAFFLLSSIAGMVFVFRRKDIYEKSAYKPGKWVVALIGLAATIGNIYLLYLVFIGYGTAAEPWILTLLLLVVGGIIYWYYRTKGSRVGVDYATIYTEIPPE